MSLPITLFLALLLAISAAHKALSRQEMAGVAARLIRANEWLGMPMLLSAAAIEILAAIAMLIPQTRLVGLALAVGLWLVYGLALWNRRGETLDCGCDHSRREKPVKQAAIARPFILIALAAASAALPAESWAIDTPFAAIALLALWFAASELSAITSYQKA